MYTSVRPYCLIVRSAGIVYDPMRVGRSRNIRNEEEDGTDREDEDEEGSFMFEMAILSEDLVG